MVLNEEQRKRVEDNINLVYNVINNMKLYNNQDAISEGFLYLCKASVNYDSSKARFSTFATHYIRYGILNMLKNDSLVPIKQSKTKHVEVIYMSEYIDKAYDIVNNSLSNNSNIEEDIINNITNKHLIELIYKKSNDTQKSVLNGILEDKSNIQIAKELNTSPSYISVIKSKIKVRDIDEYTKSR